MKTHLTSKNIKKEQQVAAAHKNDRTKTHGMALEDNRQSTIIQQKKNNTGLPDHLKSGIEQLSGHSLDDVKVHYNSSKPAQLNAHAYAQGSHIHVASGQEKHLPHEAWHIVQQKQGRVQPTKTVSGAKINDDANLEKEADFMGAKALQRKVTSHKKIHYQSSQNNTVQLAKGKKKKAEKKAAKAAQEASRREARKAKQAQDAILYETARAGKSRKVNRINKRKQEEAETAAFNQEREHLETHGHEQTHRNIVTRPARRGSITEANLLDTVHPAGAAIPDAGLSLDDFRARFQPLVQGGKISPHSLNTLMPQGKAVDFPPARGRNAKTEIRAGRKWEIPNPDGGTHAVWVHTNDPTQAEGNSSKGPIVRVRDSSGKHLSSHPIALTEDLKKQKEALKKKGKHDAAQSIEDNNTGFWTKPNDDRADSQHIPFE